MNPDHSDSKTELAGASMMAVLDKALDRLTALGAVALSIWFMRGHWEDQRIKNREPNNAPLVIFLQADPEDGPSQNQDTVNREIVNHLLQTHSVTNTPQSVTQID